MFHRRKLDRWEGDDAKTIHDNSGPEERTARPGTVLLSEAGPPSRCLAGALFAGEIGVARTGVAYDADGAGPSSSESVSGSREPVGYLLKHDWSNICRRSQLSHGLRLHEWRYMCVRGGRVVEVDEGLTPSY